MSLMFFAVFIYTRKLATPPGLKRVVLPEVTWQRESSGERNFVLVEQLQISLHMMVCLSLYLKDKVRAPSSWVTRLFSTGAQFYVKICPRRLVMNE